MRLVYLRCNLNMVTLLISEKYVVFSSCQNCLLAYEILSGKKLSLEVPKDLRELEKAKGSTEIGSDDQILSCAFSTSGKYFAASDDLKTLVIWHVNDSWKLISTRSLPRRSTAITFDKAEVNVLVADKSGDVHCFPIFSANEKENIDTLVMGHVSMLLDLKLCGTDKFLVTCDRDEKIRVSHYPNAYNIQSFCLGHTDFVSQLLYLEDLDLIASGSGDGTVKLWNYRTGLEISSVDCMSHIALMPPKKCQSTGPVNETCCRGLDVKCLVYCKQRKLIAVALEGLSLILFFNVSVDGGEMMILSFAHRALTSGRVLAISADNGNKLVTVEGSDDDDDGGDGDSVIVVVIYCLDEDNDGRLQVTRLIDGSSSSSSSFSSSSSLGLSGIVEQVNDEMKLNKSTVAVKSKFPALHKVRSDNMREYLSRKQDRLHQEEEMKKNRRRNKKTASAANDKSSSEDDNYSSEGKTRKKNRLNNKK